MPCYDGREEQDRKDGARRYDAMTALLCGVLKRNAQALSIARMWEAHHERVDLYRSGVKYDFEDPRIRDSLDQCNNVLDQAYKALCSTPSGGVDHG